MTFQDIWNQLLRKRPELADKATKLEFSSENLEQLLRQVYDQAFKQGKEVNKPTASSGFDFNDIWKR